jgi:hypothetical protein
MTEEKERLFWCCLHKLRNSIEVKIERRCREDSGRERAREETEGERSERDEGGGEMTHSNRL